MTSYYNLRWKGTLNYLKKLNNSQYLPLSEIERLQEKKLIKLIKYAYKNVPFYKRTFKELKLTPDDIRSIDDLEKLPIVTKEVINENFQDIISVKYSNKDLMPNSTGGSTGKNLKFYLDKNSYHYILAAVLRGDKWAGLDLGVKNAYLWGSQFDLSMQKQLLNKIFNYFQGSLFLSSYELSDKKMYEYTDKLIKNKSKVLVAYPSPLYAYAQFLSDQDIKLELDSIICSAESLFDHQRELIESVFNCKIFNRYGCREFGPIACECEKHRGLHINSERLIVEYSSLNGEINDYGEKSNLIITDLDNYAMPFIRYEIGDVGMRLEECTCSRNLPIMDIEGRKFDIIIGTNGNRLGGTFWTLLFRTMFKGIDEYQVIQTKESKLQIKIVANENVSQESLIELENKIKEYTGQDMKITLKLVEHIPVTKSGKFRFVISKL